MNVIRVKAVPGVVARTSKNGDFIPSDRYVRVDETPYIKRLRDVHGDIVQAPEEVAKAAPVAAAPKPVKGE